MGLLPGVTESSLFSGQVGTVPKWAEEGMRAAPEPPTLVLKSQALPGLRDPLDGGQGQLSCCGTLKSHPQLKPITQDPLQLKALLNLSRVAQLKGWVRQPLQLSAGLYTEVQVLPFMTHHVALCKMFSEPQFSHL